MSWGEVFWCGRMHAGRVALRCQENFIKYKMFKIDATPAAIAKGGATDCDGWPVVAINFFAMFLVFVSLSCDFVSSATGFVSDWFNTSHLL